MPRIKKPCGVDGCKYRIQANGYCQSHNRNFKKYGKPFLTTLDRFFMRVDKTDSCWNWTGMQASGGYGRFAPDGPGKFRDRVVRAHRFAYAEFVGEIPEFHVVDHICHNKLCVNPEHLRVATHSENLSNLPGGRGEFGRNISRNGGGFSVSMAKDGRLLYFGTYRSVDSARRVAEIARSDVFGEFAGKG